MAGRGGRFSERGSWAPGAPVAGAGGHLDRGVCRRSGAGWPHCGPGLASTAERAGDVFGAGGRGRRGRPAQVAQRRDGPGGDGQPCWSREAVAQDLGHPVRDGAQRRAGGHRRGHECGSGAQRASGGDGDVFGLVWCQRHKPRGSHRAVSRGAGRAPPSLVGRRHAAGGPAHGIPMLVSDHRAGG